jgi:NADH-quinone oxidoreductase subunit M
MLLFLISLPVIGCLILLFTDKTNINFIRNFSLFWSLLILNACVLLLFFFDQTSVQFQFIETSSWLSSININLILGIDGLALIMIILTAFLIPVCILLCWNKSLTNQSKEYSLAFFFSLKQSFFVSFQV